MLEVAVGLKGLVEGGKNVSERLGVIWVSIISSIWNARNAMVFTQADIDWERVADKVISWRIIRSRLTGFNFSISPFKKNKFHQSVAC